MLDTGVLASIAQQMMSSNTLDVNGKRVPVRRTSAEVISQGWGAEDDPKLPKKKGTR